MITREQANEFVRSLGYNPDDVVSVEIEPAGVTLTTWHRYEPAAEDDTEATGG